MQISLIKRISNHIKSAIAEAKSRFFDSFECRLKQNPKELWKCMKSSKKDSISIPPLVEGDSVTEEAFEKAQCFNRYFSSVFPSPLSPTDQHSICTLVVQKPMEDVLSDTRGIEQRRTKMFQKQLAQTNYQMHC